MRKIGLMALALCLPLLAVQAVFARPHIHITPEIMKAGVGSPVCRASFTANVSETSLGQPYTCESTNITCGLGYRMDNVATTPPPYVDAYMCVPTSTSSKLAGSAGCSPTFNRTTSGADYYCYRDNALANTPACSPGWKPTSEDYTHGLLFGGPSTTVPRDLQPTHMFYSCAPA